MDKVIDIKQNRHIHTHSHWCIRIYGINCSKKREGKCAYENKKGKFYGYMRMLKIFC